MPGGAVPMCPALCQLAALEGSGGLGLVAGGPARALARGGSCPHRFTRSPVDSFGGERRTWPVGGVAHPVCISVPLRIELGPWNACAHDSRPVRVGESVWKSVWKWSSTVDAVDGMAWACSTSRGAFSVSRARNSRY